MLEQAARDADTRSGGDQLRRALCLAMANGGQGARDGGRTRGALMRRAALIAYTDLNDSQQAISLLGDALVAHVDPTTLDALEELTNDLGDLRQAEATLTRALAEVFEGPLVRQLLARRAKLRRLEFNDKAGAAADLKKLYELSPSDHEVLDELSVLLTELNDHRAMVQIYEDQILRGKDAGARIELARKVAQLWERELDDPREAADAWRRVLRMKQADPEATAGLERAKANMLRRASEGAPAETELEESAPKEQSVEEREKLLATHEDGEKPPHSGPIDRARDEDRTPDASAATDADELPAEAKAQALVSTRPPPPQETPSAPPLARGEFTSDTQVTAPPTSVLDNLSATADGDDDDLDIPIVDAAAGEIIVVADELAVSVDEDADDDPTRENPGEASPASKRSPPPLPRA
jgi:tetratricopeptide (TPR) repeat protein